MREHILVCLSSAPSNERLVRCAAELAQYTGGMFTALYVQTPDAPLSAEQDRRRLDGNVRLAEAAGARLETVYGEDVAFQIAEYVRLNRVSRVVVGEGVPPRGLRGYLFRKPAVTERLSALLPEQQLYIVPERRNQTAAYAGAKRRRTRTPGLWDMLVCLAVMAAATLIGLGFSALGFSVSTVISVYLLGVLIAAVLVQNYMSGALVALLSVIVFNYFFTEPRYTLLAYGQDYPVTFVVMFLVSFVTCSLAERLKSTARQFSRTSYRTQVLFDTSQMLHRTETREQTFETTARQLEKLLDRSVRLIPAEKAPAQGDDATAEAAAWVLRSGRRAGAGTETFPDCGSSLFPVSLRDSVYGVAVIAGKKQPPDAFESSLILSILGECALTLENLKIGREKEEAAVRIQNEQFRSNLLRSISHDLRTPLTAISGNASNLLNGELAFDEGTRNKLYQDIYDDAVWLTNLVENLLSVSRIEEGRIQIHREVELLGDVIDEALRHVDRHSAEHTIAVRNEHELLLVKIDARLIVQVLINLVNNAVKYTPQGSAIQIVTEKQGHTARVSVIDDGPGVPEAEQERVFEMFYSGEKRSPDSRRGVGMGLALCRAIVQAHGGEITVRNRAPHGAVFAFTLPLSEVDLHE
ncbi:MAG: DUF4118 domain-containing protein [Oscillospiraceae bacterium]|nr:DUF4118 domain-containing protein [Oscillospiraceae bacterium]